MPSSVLTWVKWIGLSVSRLRIIPRWMSMTSAEAGHPFMPLAAETAPSFTWDFALRDGSSGCSIILTSRSLE